MKEIHMINDYIEEYNAALAVVNKEREELNS